MSDPVDYSGLLHVLAGGLGNVADKVTACLARADRQSLGLACKALQDEVAARWRELRLEAPAELLRSKLLPKLRGVEELRVSWLSGLDALQDFYRLLLVLKRSGARVKAIFVATETLHSLKLPPQRSARLAGRQPEQPHDCVLTADSLQQLQPVLHLRRLELRLYGEVDAALLQPLLRAPALKTIFVSVTGSTLLDLSSCSQLQELELTTGYSMSYMDLTACLQGLQPASGLKKLILHPGFKARSQWMEYISSSFPKLETLHLERCRLPEPDDVGASQHGLQQPSFPSLKELRVNGATTQISHLALQQLLSAMTGLQRLFLENMSDVNILRLPFDCPGLAHLEELGIRQYYTPSWMIIGLLGQLARNQRRLRTLTLTSTYTYGYASGVQQLTTQDLQAFLDAAPPGLQELRLHGFSHVQPWRRHSAAMVLQAATAGVHLDIRASAQ